MWNKFKQHALSMNLKKRFIVWLVITIIAAAGFSAAGYLTFKNDAAAWETSHQEEIQSKTENKTNGAKNRAGTRDISEEENEGAETEAMWDEIDEPSLTTGEKALLISSGIAAAVLLIWYWVLCMIWAYRKTQRLGINSSVWVWATLFFNLLAIAALYIYGAAKGTCKSCGRIRTKGEQYCPRCGAPFMVKCPSCGQLAGAGDTYCPHCGARMAGNQEDGGEPAGEGT